MWETSSARAVRALLPATPLVTVKDGAVCAWAFMSEEEVFEPARQVEVVEVIGAGDAFAAGFLAGRLQGCALAEALRRGHFLAAQVLSSTSDVPAPTAASTEG